MFIIPKNGIDVTPRGIYWLRLKGHSTFLFRTFGAN